MAENQAVVVIAPHQVAVQDVPYPTLPDDDWLIVRTSAVAINPTDWKHVNSEGEWDATGCWVGFDYAGVVEHAGPAALRSFTKGDRIAGCAHGTNYYRKTDGAFARYIVVRSGIQMHIPKTLSDVEAASLGVSIFTTGLGLYQSLGLPLPTEVVSKPFKIFIYGGTTAMGIAAIQYAKLSGAEVITTASVANADYLRSLGGDHILDYKSPNLVDEVLQLAGGDLKYVYDCHGDEASSILCARVATAEEPRITTLVSNREEIIRANNPSAVIHNPLGYRVFGEAFWYGERVEATPQDYEFGCKFIEISERLLAQGKVKPPRIFQNRGGRGLEGVIHGLGELRDGKVSGGKLVYET
ncbi:Trans-enoyl reductase ACTTS2 [Paramyrothecium foliicola]|nr:Trans-enoyl reductase ACTTS2 [Paramyrothecium foliicola]